MAGAPPGNTNAKDGRMWRDAVRRAVLADDGRRLRMIADALLDKAAEGDVSAIRELGDRLDGKPAQMIGVGQDPNAAPVTVKHVVTLIHSDAGGNP
jgi:hypothetical protein